MLDIFHAESPQHIQHIRDLITEFVAWDGQITATLGFGLELLQYQYSESGLELPGDFAPPEGRLLLALWDGQPAGCAGLHQFAPGIGELKRMYVRPEFRGKRIGRALIESVIGVAREVGYTTLRLETVSFMTHAQALYHACGFRDVPPYYEIPAAFLPITVFMEQEIVPNV